MANGVEIDLGPPRQRLVLAELVAARGRAVGVDHLVDSLWGDSPPASALNQLHRYVGDLRRIFEPSLRAREVGSYVVPTPNGYRLLAGGLTSDLADFYIGSRQAAQLALLKAPSAEVKYERLLELAEREAFSDLPFAAALRPQFAEVERDRLAMAAMAADFALLQGKKSSIVDLIERIAAAVPVDERLQARIVKLFTTHGEPAKALAIYERTRHVLAEEFGISPGQELTAAYHEVLAADRSAVFAEMPSVKSANTLPRRAIGILPRDDITAALNEARTRAENGENSLVVLSGMAGVGKTTVATNWAHEVVSAFPDGCLYVDLRGCSPEEHPLTQPAVVDILLNALGFDLQGASPDPDDRKRLYLQHVSAGRFLLIFDNARNADQVRGLLPEGKGVLTVVLSRNTLTSIVLVDGGTFVPVQRLSNAESESLLVRRIGRRALDHPSAVEQMLNACAGLPLALAITAARVNLQRGRELDAVARELATARSTLDEMRIDSVDSDVRTAFSWSFRLLSPSAARMLAAMSVHPGPRISLTALASIQRITSIDAQTDVDELLAANMIRRADEQLFEAHDLIREFARERLEGQDLRAARNSLVSYYVASMRKAFFAVAATAPAYPAAWTGSVATEEFDSTSAVVRWYRRERLGLNVAMDICRSAKLYAEFACITLDARPARAVSDGSYGVPLAPAGEVLRMAELAGSRAMQAEAHRDIAIAATGAGDAEGAAVAFEAALQLHRADGNAAGEIYILRAQAIAALRFEDPQESYAIAERMLAAATGARREDLMFDALSLSLTPLVDLREWDMVVRNSDRIRELVPDAFLRGGRLIAANRAVALNKLRRHAEAWDLLLPLLSEQAQEEDVTMVYGPVVEGIVASAGLGDTSSALALMLRLESVYERFVKILTMDESVVSLLEELGRVRLSLSSLGLSSAPLDRVFHGFERDLEAVRNAPSES